MFESRTDFVSNPRLYFRGKRIFANSAADEWAHEKASAAQEEHQSNHPSAGGAAIVLPNPKKVSNRGLLDAGLAAGVTGEDGVASALFTSEAETLELRDFIAALFVPLLKECDVQQQEPLLLPHDAPTLLQTFLEVLDKQIRGQDRPSGLLTACIFGAIWSVGVIALDRRRFDRTLRSLLSSISGWRASLLPPEGGLCFDYRLVARDDGWAWQRWELAPVAVARNAFLARSAVIVDTVEMAAARRFLGVFGFGKNMLAIGPRGAGKSLVLLQVVHGMRDNKDSELLFGGPRAGTSIVQGSSSSGKMGAGLQKAGGGDKAPVGGSSPAPSAKAHDMAPQNQDTGAAAGAGRGDQTTSSKADQSRDSSKSSDNDLLLGAAPQSSDPDLAECTFAWHRTDSSVLSLAFCSSKFSNRALRKLIDSRLPHGTRRGAELVALDAMAAKNAGGNNNPSDGTATTSPSNVSSVQKSLSQQSKSSNKKGSSSSDFHKSSDRRSSDRNSSDRDVRNPTTFCSAELGGGSLTMIQRRGEHRHVTVFVEDVGFGNLEDLEFLREFMDLRGWIETSPQERDAQSCTKFFRDCSVAGTWTTSCSGGIGHSLAPRLLRRCAAVVLPAPSLRTIQDIFGVYITQAVAPVAASQPTIGKLAQKTVELVCKLQNSSMVVGPDQGNEQNNLGKNSAALWSSPADRLQTLCEALALGTSLPAESFFRYCVQEASRTVGVSIAAELASVTSLQLSSMNMGGEQVFVPRGPLQAQVLEKTRKSGGPGTRTTMFTPDVDSVGVVRMFTADGRGTGKHVQHGF